MIAVDEAKAIAQVVLHETQPRRWRHVQAVGKKAESLDGLFRDRPDAHMLAAAAWLHDVGYAPTVIATGFHPLDGGRWLRAMGVDERLCAYVTHHSYANLEAIERGLAAELSAEFRREEGLVADALCYADMTTGPDGQDLDVRDRLAEIRARYGRDHLVTRFITRAEPDLIGAVGRTQKRLIRLADPEFEPGQART